VSGVPGLTVNSATGVLSGVPTSAGGFTLAVTLTDANNISSFVSQNYPVTVTYPPLMITSAAPPASGTVGVPYGPYTVTASGGSGSYLWSATGLPGVTINGATGVLSGTPNAAATGLTVTVTDTVTNLSVSAVYPVTIAGAVLGITTSSLLGNL
jgi:hypothetical protein